MSFDDGSKIEIQIPEDPDPPTEDACALEDITDEEAELGAFLGAMIDIDDDDSDGSEWAGVTKEELEEMNRS